ncbi:MAG: ImpA family type VI secretion system protein, partial [Terriglobia bacterium]
MFQRSVAASSPSFFKPLRDNLAAALEACGDLEKFLDGSYGKEAPSLRTFREGLESANALAGQILSEREGTRDVAVFETLEETPPILEVKDPIVPLPASTVIRSRDEAFQMLREAADCLQTVEPHSPVSYLVRRAISWGSMTLEELLPELVRNEDALTDTFKMLQIQNPK